MSLPTDAPVEGATPSEQKVLAACLAIQAAIERLIVLLDKKAGAS